VSSRGGALAIIALVGCESEPKPPFVETFFDPPPRKQWLAREIEPRGFDVLHYDLDFRFAGTGTTVHALADVEIEIVEPVDRLLFDLVGYDVERIEVDGRAAPFAAGPDPDTIAVEVPPYEIGSRHMVGFTYRGRPTVRRSTLNNVGGFTVGWHGFDDDASGDLNRMRFSLNQTEGARLWFPSIDHPSDKATLSLAVEVPEDLSAVSNGVALARRTVERNGVRYGRYAFTENNPIATYLVHVTVGKLATDKYSAAGVEIDNYFPNTMEPVGVRERLADLEPAMEIFQRHYGAYPFGRYGHMIVVGGHPTFGLEHQTISLINGRLFDEIEPERLTDVVVHELAHQWMGDLVTPSNHHSYWLNEGMATFSELLYLEQTGADHQRIERTLDRWTLGRESYWKQHRDDPVLGDLPDDEILGWGPYHKGGAVFNMMRHELGAETFFAGLRLMLERHRGGNIDNEGLQAVMEDASGRDLDYFFDQWVYGRGFPFIRYGCKARKLPMFEQTQVDCTFRQDQNDYDLLVDIWQEILPGFGIPDTVFPLARLTVPIWVGTVPLAGVQQTGMALRRDALREQHTIPRAGFVEWNVHLDARGQQTFSLCIDKTPEWIIADPFTTNYAGFYPPLEVEEVQFICTDCSSCN
jgi:aminopeptidase N